MKTVLLFLAILAASTGALQAHLGDSLAQTIARYGQPVASSGQTGELTSTRTFNASGLQVTCGYVDGKVEMITYTRGDRAFNAVETEALLRTNGSRHSTWTTPPGGYVNGTYNRADGVTATLKDTTMTIHSPKWTDALAKDDATRKADAAKAVQEAAALNAPNPNYVPGATTNAASYAGPETNAAAGVAPTQTTVTPLSVTNGP